MPMRSNCDTTMMDEMPPGPERAGSDNDSATADGTRAEPVTVINELAKVRFRPKFRRLQVIGGSFR